MTAIMTEEKQVSTTAPHNVEGTGIRRGLLEDLALKILYLHGETSLIDLSNLMCVSLGVVEEIFAELADSQ